MTDTIILSDDDLSAAIAVAMQRHVEANRERDAALSVLSALQEEQAARRSARRAEVYVESRRAAVAKGLAPPPPPKGFVEPSVSAASARLAAMPRIGSPTTRPSAPVGEARRVEVEDAGSAGPVLRGVSDHAVVRYLERVVGVDMTVIRARIMTPFVENAMRSGVGRIRTSDGVIVARDGMVTSFLPSENGPNRRRMGHVDRGRGGRRRPDRDEDVRPSAIGD